MLKEKLTLLIHTCDKFSDLWDGHIQLLNQNWSDRDIRTVLVTDKPTGYTAEGIEVFAAGEGKELSERISSVLPTINTKYILQTLDDYFPIYPIDSEKIKRLVETMEKEHLDYLRLYKLPNAKAKLPGYNTLYQIDLNSKKDTHYQVNFYSGIWTKDFVAMTVDNSLNAWNYELSLTRIARDNHLNCAMSKGKEFEILDVVRRGQLMHKSARYLKKHPELYRGNRPVISRKFEIVYNARMLTKKIMPQRFIDILKSVARKGGKEFYSDGSAG